MGKLFPALIFVSICSFCASSNFESQESLTAFNLLKEDLDESFNAAHKYSPQAQQVPNLSVRPNKAKPTTTLYPCDEVIFEDGTMINVPVEEPSCLLQGHSDTEVKNRNKRSLSDVSQLTTHRKFFIPARDNFTATGKPKEKVAETSYIKLQFKVCSQPGGEVRVYDSMMTSSILHYFKNGGTAYKCNLWTMDYEDSISNTAEVQVEYVLPVGNEEQMSEVSYEFLNSKNEGHRRIQFGIPGKSKDEDIKTFELDILYSEVKFVYEEADHHVPVVLDIPKEWQSTSEDVELGPFETNYTANWVRTYILGRRSRCESDVNNCQDKYYVGISVEIMELNLDFDKGDYLIIGAGMLPEFWKNSKAQMIAHKIDEKDEEKHKIWINTDSAFIRIVTHNSLIDSTKKPQTALKFTWTPANTTLDGTKVDEVSQFLRDASIRMCFVDSSCSNFLNLRDPFVDEIVNIFNHYTTDNEKSVTSLINEDSVRIFENEPIFYPHGHYTDQYCQFSIAIASPYDSEFPLVQSDVLSKLIFGSSDMTNAASRQMLKKQVTFDNCIHQRINWWAVVLPIVIIILVSTAIVLIFWRVQNNMMRNLKYKKKNSQSREPLHLESGEDALQY